MKDKKDFYVYEWYIKETNEVFYVGKGRKNRYKVTSGRNKFFQCMYKSHDCDVRKKYEGLTEDEAFKKEIELIRYYRNNTNYRLTNQTEGGEGSSGFIPTQDTKKKMSLSMKRKWENISFRKKMIEIRNKNVSPYKTLEFRNKISNIVKGENNPNFNHFWTKSQKKQLSEKQIRSGMYKDEKNPNSKRIICVETGEVFNCIKFAKEKYNIKSEGSLTVALKCSQRTAGGFHWVLYSEYYLSKSNRFNYLYNLLLKNNKLALICVEDCTLYNTLSNLSQRINVSCSKIKYNLNKHKKFLHNEKTYMLLKEYNSRFI